MTLAQVTWIRLKKLLDRFFPQRIGTPLYRLSQGRAPSTCWQHDVTSAMDLVAKLRPQTRGHLPGITLTVPLARPEAWLNPKGLQQSEVRGIHTVFMAEVGGSCEACGHNKHSWCKTYTDPKRTDTLAGCCCLMGTLQADGEPVLALTKGPFDALALHWHRGIPVAAACGSLSGLCDAAEELAFLTRWPYLATLELWTDQDQKTNPPTGLQVGLTDTLNLIHALRAEGVSDNHLVIKKCGQDV